jgi:hypothetical protein
MSRPTFNIGRLLEKEKLKAYGSSFTSRYRTLRILLTTHKMTYVLEVALGDKPTYTASQDERNVFQSKVDDSDLAQSGMLYDMEDELQKCFENMGAFEIIANLKAIFAPQARVERYEASELFF